MFQYAAGRRLAYTLGVNQKLDLSWFKNCEKCEVREYGLGVFNIKELIATPHEIKRLMFKKEKFSTRMLNRIMRKPRVLSDLYVDREHHVPFDPDILNLTDGCYLDGHWQTEKYFLDTRKIIREEFQIKPQADEKNKEIQRMITSSHAISLHIRRGDYVTNLSIKNMFDVCNLDYYKRCVNAITQEIKNPYFFIFSDDMAWVKEHFNIPFKTHYVEDNQDQPFEDLRLMSLCKHNIMANSSFSWWGGVA